MVNVFGGKPNVVVSKQTISFLNAGITADNTAVIFLVDNPLKSYVPGRPINGITGFEKGKGYYLVATQDIDLQKWVVAPLVRASTGPVLVAFQGESNSGGTALNTDPTPQELAARSAVQIFNNNTMTLQPLDIGTNNLIGHNGLSDNATHGFELILANRTEAGTFAQAPVYLVKTGQGATKIADWAEGATYNGIQPWALAQTRIDQAISLITAATGNAPSLYMMWSLGINDALSGTNQTTWKAAVLAHWDKVRVKYPGIPIVATGLTAAYPTWTAAIQEIAGQRADTFFVPTTGATEKDVNHWDYNGYKLIGNRWIDILLENYAI